MKAKLFLFISLLTVLLTRVDAVINWGQPVDLTTPVFGAYLPSVTYDGMGNAYAIWIDAISGNVVYVEKSAGASNWSSPPIPLGTTNALQSLTIAAFANGNLVATWTDYIGGFSAVMAATKPFGGSWSAPIMISNSPFDDAVFPSLRLDNLGNAYVVWLDSTGVYSSSLPFGGAWTPIILVPTIRVVNPLTSLAVDASGNAVVVGLDLFNGSAYASTLPAGTSVWSAATLLDGTPAVRKASVAISPSGSAVAVWTTNANQVGSAVLSPFGGTWSILPPFGAVTANSNFNQISLDVGADGTAAITYTDSGATISSASLPLGGAWSTPTVISNNTGISSTLKIDTSGDVVAVWFNSGGTVLQSSILSNGTWSPLSDLSTSGALSSVGAPNLVLALSADGNAEVLWAYTTGGNPIIQSISGVNPNAFRPPSQLLLSQKNNDFAVLSEWYNFLRWAPSPSSNVTGYNIYRNGVLIDSVSNRTYKYKDHNRKKGESVTYGVASVANGVQSQVVTISLN